MKRSMYHVIGVMSGTSLDGVDLCYVTFTKNNRWKFDIHHSKTIPYSKEWQQKLKQAISYEAKQLGQLDTDYTLFLARVISGFIEDFKIKTIDAICSHGHTVFHQPEKGVTKQIGNLEHLAKVLQQQIVCDFRVQDVDFGGQGAPLVPIGDRLLFSEFDYCLNLGGFANISFEREEERVAYDICPVNIVLNRYSERLGMSYDIGGNIARSGALNLELLADLNRLKFYQQPPPKSLGLEWVENSVIPLIDSYDMKTENILRTMVEHAALQISNVIPMNSRVLFTGGGAYNTFLMACISGKKPLNMEIPDATIIEYKEAIIFGFLGVLKLRNEINCLRSVTGAFKDHSSGKIFRIKTS
ncbi:MAG: anhydro-N-acetylmuramic acid kinase [Flavobacteriaceae bacterium]|nr:anhydro-N-acetylmuramic acid kinase [Flavobacteriaceae bacterium]